MMCFKDWRTIFGNLFMAIKFSEKWSGWRIRDSWDKNSAGFGAKTIKDYATTNPQYILDVAKDDTTIFI